MSDRCCFYKSGHVCDAFCGLGPLVQIENLRSIPRGVGFFFTTLAVEYLELY